MSEGNDWRDETDPVRRQMELGPWFVFVCSRDGSLMEVGYSDDEYETCGACGAELAPVPVVPTNLAKVVPS